MTIIPDIAAQETPVEQLVAQKIIAKLRVLGIKGIRIEHAIVGPVITGYPIEFLQNSTATIAKITAKNKDIALACGVDTVDIRSVGNRLVVYVPNSERKIVDFKEALFWYLKDEKVASMQLPILLGTDVEGNNSVIDLAEQPHILIAGSTGAGKSVFESAIIASLAMKKSTEELELFLVDTKRVDLTLFRDLPHVQEVARDAHGWYLLINSIYQDVQDRNLMFEKVGARNISEYNAMPGNKLPYKVVIIDELADLIEKDAIVREEAKLAMKVDEDAEEHNEPKVIDALKRIIQICRASGVHIIACTQRTSVDIVSGTVKANFPTRISLRLPSSVDSRVILGENGAENLLGKGDMLVKSADSDILSRFHGPFVKLSDIELILHQREMILQSLGV